MPFAYPTIVLALSLLLLTFHPSHAAGAGAAAAAARCAPGSFRTGGKCEPCPAGSYQWLPNQDACTPCPVNTFTDAIGVVDRRLCRTCPVNAVAKPGSSVCTLCPEGQIRDGFKPRCRKCSGTKCAKPCPAGMTSEQSHDGGCEKIVQCPTGFIAPPPYTSYFDASVCISASTGCPDGLSLFGWYRLCVCQKPSGTVVCPKTHVFDGQDRCLKCYGGSRIVKDTASGRLQCHRCSGNSISPGGLSRECTPCAKGSVSMGDSCFNIPRN